MLLISPLAASGIVPAVSFGYLFTAGAMPAFWMPLAIAAFLASWRGPSISRQIVALAAAVIAGLLLTRWPIFPAWPAVGPLGRLPWLLAVDALALAFLAPRLGPRARWALVAILLLGTAAGVAAPSFRPDQPRTPFVWLLLTLFALATTGRFSAEGTGGRDRLVALLGMTLAVGLVAGLYPSRTAVHALTLLAALLGLGWGCGVRGEAVDALAAQFALIALTGLIAAIAVLTPGRAVGLGLALAISIAAAPPIPARGRARLAIQGTIIVALIAAAMLMPAG